MLRNYKDLNAVYEDDLDSLLEQVGLLESLNAGKLKCKFCKNVVARDEIYSVIKDSDTHKVVCSRAECVSALMQYLDDKRRSQVNG